MEDEQQELSGYGQTPPNPYGYPPYGYPPQGYGYGYGYPRPATGTNGQAIASLVLGICGFLLATPVIGLIFGILSLSAVKKTGQKGKGLAISGIVLSSAWIAIFATFITIGVLAMPDPARRDASGTVVSPGTISVFALRTKDCFTWSHGLTGSRGTETSTVEVVPCSTAHDSEAIGSFTLAEDTLPAADDMHTESTKQCVKQLDASVPDPMSLPTGSHMEYLYPDRRAWDNGERQVTCFLQFPTATMTQSVIRDPSSYTVDQMVFLDADNPVTEAVDALRETPKSADISVLRQRAADVVDAVQGEESRLKSHQWSAEAQPAVDALIANHEAVARIWTQAEASSDATTFFDAARQAYAAFSVKDLVAVRNTLGLTTASGGGTTQTA